MKKLVERKEYLDKLFPYKGKEIIKVVTGLSRSGKSILLELFMNRLLTSGINERQIQFYSLAHWKRSTVTIRSICSPPNHFRKTGTEYDTKTF
jgi:predicted YcjX-like family ATPase